MYLVLALKTKLVVEALGQETELDFTQAGYVGMCPVFETRDEALKCNNGDCKIIEIEFVKKEATE